MLRPMPTADLPLRLNITIEFLLTAMAVIRPIRIRRVPRRRHQLQPQHQRQLQLQHQLQLQLQHQLRPPNTNSYADTDSYPDSYTTPTPAATPAAPTNLKARAKHGQVTLTWTDNANNETGFRVERSTNGTVFSVIASPGANTANYKDSTTVRRQTYYYRVAARNNAGLSSYSNVVTATP